MGSFTAKTRNMCRKAERAGITVAEEPAAIDEYFALYAASAESWGYDEPPYSRALFDAWLETGFAELWIGRIEGRAAAGALLLRGSSDLLYWSGAMDRAFGSLGPSNAVLRTVIESGCERGIDYVDFGASTGLPRVEAFKRSFGASAREFVTVKLSTGRHRAIDWAQRRARRRRAPA